MASEMLLKLRTSPIWNLSFGLGNSCRISSCFFSSRLKMRISPMSVWRKRRKTALPKLPVPPVISRVLFLNIFGFLGDGFPGRCLSKAGWTLLTWLVPHGAVDVIDVAHDDVDNFFRDIRDIVIRDGSHD